MKQFNITENEIFKFIQDKKINDLIKFQTQRAINFYHTAINHLSDLDRKSQKPGLMMGNIYFVLLSEIAKDQPENILNQKTVLPNFRKFQIALLTFFNYRWIN